MPRKALCKDSKANKVGSVMELHVCTKPKGHEGRHTDGNIQWNQKQRSTNG